MERTPFPFKPSTFKNWQSVMEQKHTVRLEVLNTGTIRIPRVGTINTEHPLAGQLPQEAFFAPVLAFLLRHPEQGNFLIDAGLDKSFADPNRWEDFPTEQAPGQDTASQLAARNVALRGILFTHLHLDHYAGMIDIPGLACCVVNKGAEDVPPFDEQPDAVYEFDFSTADQLAPFDRCIDVFGDGSCWAIATPGHVLDHVSYLVFTEAQPVLLCGDVAYIRWSFDNGVEPGWVDNRELAVRSLQQLRDFAAQFPQVRVICGHEV